MRIDAHQHFWRYDPAEYPWIGADWPLRRDFLPKDLQPELAACKLDGCVAVQARQTLAESRWLLELAEQHDFIQGVVGWVDLRSTGLESQLREFVPHPKFVGVRHVVQDEPDDNFMLGTEFQRGIAALEDFGLTYDLLVFPRQLPAANQLARNFPRQPLVLDHIAKPPIARRLQPSQPEFIEWSTQIRRLAECENVFCKLSGMVTEADWHNWEAADFEPYLRLVVQAFGPERLMYGSDWPVALLAGSYARVYVLTHDYVAGLGEQAEKKVFGENTMRFYGLERS
ncbi:MAG: amidohydrolase family protein [Pirellulales bacterium]|nr:amidohydrolase family protein [Pirellulales bacterium]